MTLAADLTAQLTSSLQSALLSEIPDPATAVQTAAGLVSCAGDLAAPLQQLASDFLSTCSSGLPPLRLFGDVISGLTVAYRDCPGSSSIIAAQVILYTASLVPLTSIERAATSNPSIVNTSLEMSNSLQQRLFSSFLSGLATFVEGSDPTGQTSLQPLESLLTASDRAASSFATSASEAFSGVVSSLSQLISQYCGVMA